MTRETNEEYSDLGVHRCSRPRCSPVTEHVKLKPWGVQLSAGFSREDALAAYAVIATRYATLLADKDTTIVGSVLQSRFLPSSRRHRQV
jgi:hypothetical protein